MHGTLLAMTADDVAAAYGCAPLNDVSGYLATLRPHVAEHPLAAFDEQAANVARMWVAPEEAAAWGLFRSKR